MQRMVHVPHKAFIRSAQAQSRQGGQVLWLLYRRLLREPRCLRHQHLIAVGKHFGHQVCRFQMVAGANGNVKALGHHIHPAIARLQFHLDVGILLHEIHQDLAHMHVQQQ